MQEAKLWARLLRENRSYWRREFPARTATHHGVALIECSLTGIPHLHGVVKVGLAFTKLRNLQPFLVPSPFARRAVRRLLHSMSARVARSAGGLFKAGIVKAPSIVRILWRLQTGKDLLELNIDGHRIGRYLYNSTLGRYCIPTIDALLPSMRAYLALRIAHYYYFRDLVLRNDVRLVILGDPSYVCGLLFEICREADIPCVNAINIDILQAHKYYDRKEYANHFRQIESTLLAKLPADGLWQARLDEYLDTRMAGGLQTHDAIAAFGSSKRITTVDQLKQRHRVDQSKPLVVVMAHAFTDAPHALPRLLYQDYFHWLRGTVGALLQNVNVNFLVREHPASPLYRESGIVQGILAALGAEERLIDRDVNTASVIAAADCFVTCGGTIGLEAGALGKPTVLGGQAAYAGLGFTQEFSDVDQYEQFLRDGVSRIRQLTAPQLLTARRAAYIGFQVFNNRRPETELAGARADIGFCDKTITAFIYQALVELGTPFESQAIYQQLAAGESAPYSSIVDVKKFELLD